MRIKHFFFALVAMLICSVSSVFAQVAKIGDTEYQTLQAAMTEANKAAGNYTITLLADNAEVFTFAQKSGVNITIDGDGNTFSGKITLNAGGGNLTFTDAKIAPANSQTIYLNATTAPNVTFDGCTLQGANKSGTIIYGYTSATSNALTVKNCTADNLQYIISHRQTGAKSVLVENVTASNMIYLVRTLKCPSVTVKNVTVSDAVIGIDIKNDAAGGKLTLEDVNINIVTYNGSVYAPVSGSGAGKSWTVEFKGNNTFSANGVAYEDLSWFSGNAGYVIKDANVAKIGDKLYYDFATAFAAAQPGQTIVLLADYTGEPVTLAEGVKLEANGFNADNITVQVPNYVAQIGEQGYETLAEAFAAAQAGQEITLAADITENVTVSKKVTIEGAGYTYTGAMELKADATIKNLNFDGKGYNGYAITTRGAQYLTIEACTAKNYGFGLVQLASATALTTVKNVTVSNMGYGVKVDYSGAVVLENVDITASTAAVLNSNFGEKTITIKNSKLNILGTWTRNSTVKTNYVFEGANAIDKFIVDAAIDNFKLEAGATLTAPEEISVTTVEDYEVKYEDGAYKSVEMPKAVMIGEQGYATLADALAAAQAGATITLAADITENVTVSKKVTIDGAGKTYTGNMNLKADATIKNVNFDGKGYNGYAVETRGANYVTIEDCTAKNYGYGLVQLASATALTTVKNVTVSNMGYGVKVDYSGAVVLENVDITASTAAVLNSNFGEKTITIKNSKLNILGTWTRNNTTKTNYVFEGENAIDKFIIDAAIDNFKLVAGATLTAPEEISVTTVKDYEVKYEDGAYKSVEMPKAVMIGEQGYETLAAALAAAKAGDVITLLKDATIETTINGAGLTIDGKGHTLTYTGSGASARAIDVKSESNGANLTVKNLTIDCTASYCQRGINYNTTGELVLDGVTVKGTNVTYALNLPGSSVGANVTINNSNLTANIALNVWGKNAEITATDSHFTSVDNSTAENYSAVALNNDGTTAAEGAVVNIIRGSITAKDENGNLSNAVRNATATGQINVSDETTVTGIYSKPVAIVTYGSDQFYSCATLQAAIDKAIATNGSVKLIADVEATEIITVNAPVVIDGNGKTLKSTAGRAINIETEGKVVINNLTVKAAERAFNIINEPATVELNGVTATANNNAVMIATSAGAANVTINGCDFTGLAVVNVAGAGAQVAINDTKITNVDANKAENYGAITVYSTATNAKVTVNGGSITVADDSKKAYIFAEGATVTGVDQIGQIVAMIGDAGYETLTEAIADAKEGQTVKMVYDVTLSEILVINKAITLDGNGKTLTSTAARAINVSGADGVTIQNLTINASGERAINVIQNATNVTIEKVTATAANYTVNVAGSAPNAVVAIKNSTLNGLCTVNVAAAGANVTVDNSTVNCNDNNTTAGEAYAALSLNKEAVGGSIVATNTIVNVAEGSDSQKGRNGAEDGTVTINGSTDGVAVMVAVITYPGSDYYHSFASLAKAVEFAKAGDVITLIRDVTGAGVVINKSITIDFNGKTYTANVGVGSTGTETLALQILKGDVVLKNGTLTSEGANIKMLINNYTNLNVDNMKLVDDTDAIQYVLSNNSGTVNIVNGSEITANGAIALDACKYASYAAPTVNVAEGVTVNGNVEVSATLNMNGTLNGAIVINGAEGVVNGAEGLNVSTTVGADYKVAYADGKYAVVAKNYVAQVGETKYESLAEAVAAGGEVTFLADINENVTLAKNVTIDGAGKNYTGTMTVNNVTVTIENVAFVKGQVYKHKSTGANAQITIKDCTFDGQGLNAYAVNVGNGKSLAIENVTATNYGYGLLQVPSSFSSISVKDVEVSNMGYGFKVDYAGAVAFENVTVADDVTIGIYDSNYGDKTYTIKNSEISSISIWERSAAKTTTFKFEGLNKVTSFTTSQYAKVVAEAKSSNNYYGDLAAVVAATQDGVTVELLADVTLEGGNEMDDEAGLVIDKAITFEGNGHTIDCGTFVKGIRIYGHSNLTDININNVTVVNNNVYGRCVDTRKGYLRLKFNNAKLVATNGNSQPLTVGGNEQLHQIDLSSCTIDAGNSGYAIISFVPTNQAIKIMNSTVTGYAGIYLKGDGTKVTITTNSKVIGKNVHTGETNGFGAVVIEGNNNTVNINATSPMLKAVAEGGAEQAAILVKSGTGNKVVLETSKGANIVAEGENAYWAMINEAAEAKITKNGAEVALVAEANGWQFASFEEAVSFAKNGGEIKLLSDIALDTKTLVTDCDGYSSIINVEDMELTFDLNGKTITVDAAAADLAGAKSKMLMAVFSVDDGGKLTIDDSSEAKNGAVKVTANDATVYSLAAAYGKDAKLTINNGSYYVDVMPEATSLIYAQRSESVIINGGTYNIGNVGTGANGSPWIFNSKGQNMDGVYVYGGTYPTDINHQFWFNEAIVPGNLAVKANENGTWSVVEAAAYTSEIGRSTGSWRRNVGYATIEEAIAATQTRNCEGNVVTLAKNVEIEQMITVANGVEVTLDLNGKTLAATDNTSKNYSAIDNRGDLTIVDSSEDGIGKITVEATVNSGWNRYSAVIANNPGGKLTVNGGTIEHLGGTDMAYGIDNLTNGKDTYAETEINGGVIKSTYRAVRQFLNGVEAQNILTINGGTIEGANKSIFFHDPSAKANNGTLYVDEEATLNGDVYLYVTAGSTEWPVEVYVDKAALGENEILSANVPAEAAALVEYDTFWQVEQKNLAELTIVDEEYAEYINKVEKNVAKLTYVRDFENTEWQTIYLPFEVPVEALTAAGLEAAYIYNASYKNGEARIDHVEMTEGSLAANYPYMIRAKEAGEKVIVVENAVLEVTKDVTIDCSSVFEKFTFTGNYAALEAEDLVSTNKVKNFVLEDGVYSELEFVGAFRFYLTIEKRQGEFPAEVQPIRMRTVNANGEETTGINGVDAEQAGDFIFDLHGRRVLETEKGGIYIKNGKKFIAQ